MITPERLDEIKADISANKKAADELLVDEGWAGVEKSQKNMAELIAAKIRALRWEFSKVSFLITLPNQTNL